MPAPRLLIVDDEPDTCANLSDILTDLGYQVDTAEDGESALALVRQHFYDLALLDLQMPGMDGLELYRRIREISSGTVAMIVTAYASSDTAREVLASGAWRIIPKPVDARRLLQTICQALDAPLVLVVDDDRDLCDNLRDLLQTRGCRVQLAYDIPDAQHLLEQHRFQVVLIDMKLPAGSGQEVLYSLQALDPQARTVLITGHAELEARVQAALQAGANAVCYKPFDVNQLLSTVAQFCAVLPPTTA